MTPIASLNKNKESNNKEIEKYNNYISKLTDELDLKKKALNEIIEENRQIDIAIAAIEQAYKPSEAI
jgi:hypothetical protein